MLHTIDDSSFDALVVASERPVLVEFGATWCPPCRMMAPVLDDIAVARSDVRIATIDVDANPVTQARYSVMSVPTLLLFVDGVPVRQVIGFTPKGRLLELIDEALDAATAVR
ncbi:MAG: thioredoxin 1 [Chloroflexota bacterium]|jgi:thioredoxin 1|nr:thioredoxin 1 [Chloroflexota bacterium]